MPTTLVQAAPPLQRRPGRYAIGQQLAEGGMGVIHRARDRIGERDVAYKRMVIKSGRSRALMTALFQREYDTLARLRHPNIVDVYDYGVDAEGPYYVMELLEGEDLAAHARLAYPEACRILRDVASALALVHARRLIHRDVSPGNVRLTGDGRAKLIDFGGLTSFGRPRELVGTPAFLAPECLTDAPLDQRSDVFSLGAVAYWLLTGRPTIRVASILDVIEAWERPLLPPSVLDAALPRELDELVMAMLATDPLRRPASMAYVIERLTALADLAPEVDPGRVAYSYLEHPPLVGRDDALALVDRALSDALEGRGGSVLVEASAGLGRSALLDGIALKAQLAGAAVVRATGDRNAAPFAIARSLTDAALVLYPELEGTTHRARSSFLSVRPLEGGGRGAPSAVDHAARQALVIDAVEETLLEASRRGPLVIVIDDVHASDAESLALLASVSGGLARSALLLVTSARVDVAPTDGGAFARLAARAARVPLGALSEAQIVELLEAIFGGVPNTRRLAQWLHAQSAGHPATVMDLARRLLARGAVRYLLGTFTLPHDVDDDLGGDLGSAVLSRLGELPDDARRLTELLSLREGALTSAQLAVAAALPERAVLLALEGLVRRGLVAETPEGLMLSGSTLRSAVSASIDAAERRALDARIAGALLASGETLELRLEASTHLLRAGRAEQAAEQVAAIPQEALISTLVTRWVPLLEALLEVYRRQGRSRERCLSLMLPIAHAGFFGDVRAQMRHIDEALAWMSDLTGMSLAQKLRRFLGGKLALVVGMLCASLRRVATPARDRLGPMRTLLAHFVGLVSGATPSAVSRYDGVSPDRFTAWLSPLAVLPKQSSGYLVREFCVSTAALGRGEFRGAIERYGRLVDVLAAPVPGMHERLRDQLYLGSVHGLAQASIMDSDPTVLALADRLAESNPFFAPHAEGVRAAYYWYRGELDKAETHRERAELLALRGGIHWSAVTVLTVRRAHGAMLGRDPISLVQAISELERLTAVAPAMEVTRRLGDAWLAYLRGRPAEGVALVAPVVADRTAWRAGPWRLTEALWAELLNAAGDHERALSTCLELLEEPSPDAKVGLASILAAQQRAMAEAHLGGLGAAIDRMDALLAAQSERDNPLVEGGLHRDRALLALLAGDSAGFERHLEQMGRCYRATRNPALIEQAEPLVAQAIERGLRADPRAAARRLEALRERDGLDGSTVVGAPVRRAGGSTPP